jgi:hypothetical protein
VDFPLPAAVCGHSPRGLGTVTSISGLPPCIAKVLKAVADGVEPARQFATLRGIAITNASERFRVA